MQEVGPKLPQQCKKRKTRSKTLVAVRRDPQDVAEATTFDLTGKTGSFMYMAPEVYLGQQYNEKADVFSFGCLLHEVFAHFILSTLVVGPTGNPQAAKIFACKVQN